MLLLWQGALVVALLLNQVVANPVGGGSSDNQGEEGAVRLLYGEKTDDLYSGRIEIFHDGEWGTVCDDGADAEDALIICRGLGYERGELLDSLDIWMSPTSSGPIWIDSINCDADHSSLSDCRHNGWGINDCSHSEDLQVLCSGHVTEVTPSAAREGEARLSDGERTESSWSGRVEIYHDGEWGTVCDDDVNREDAEIICRGLGYGRGSVLSSVPAGTGPIWMDQIDCDEPQTELAECDHQGWGSHDCSHAEDFGITCTEPMVPFTTEGPANGEGEVRLVGGRQSADSWSGRVEIYHDGQWGTVCDDGLKSKDFTIICNGLGYLHGSQGDVEAGTGPIWMDSVECNVGDTGLADCNHEGWGSNDCGHHEDVGAICEGALNPVTTEAPVHEGDVRLMDGERTVDSLSGRVEIYHDGQWGTVCDDWFDSTDYNIICKGLGYAEGREGDNVADGTGQIWMDGVDCDSDHAGLHECDHNGWGQHDCTHDEDVDIICEGRL